MQILPEHISAFLSKCKSSQWAGVFFSLPGQTNFELWLQPLSKIESLGHEYFVFSPFQTQTSPPIFITPVYKNQEALGLIGTKSEGLDYWENEGAFQLKTTTKEAHKNQFDEYLSFIGRGDCVKAILSTVVKQEIRDGFDIGNYVFTLRKTYPQAFVYVLSSPFAGTWIGATPETLVKWNEREVTTMSLAGTKNANTPHYNFGEKEKNEQEIVTNYIESVFKKYFSEVEINKREELHYGDITHLLSRVKAIRNNNDSTVDILQLSRELHPTPAVGGYPVKEAVELISSIETHHRLYYSGYLGPVNDNSGELAVNLRCMTLTHKNCYVFAGGGITSDSMAESEWAETRLKANALLKFL